jgi:hypothetical protein
MSTQSPTPRGSERPLWLVAAIGLMAFLWSCESEQVGYDVSIPLLGPTEFQQTSCEDSGDLCTSDNECFDEDGFDVGPCTKTMKELGAITVPVSLSPSNPSYTLGAQDTNGWTTLFLAQQFSDGELPEGARTVMTMDGFSLQGAPVTLAVRIFSRIGLIAGRPTSYQPVTPSSCTFTLDDTSTGQDYADGINTCLSDWIADNGAPLDFDMEVTSSFGAAANVGVGQKQLEQAVVGTFEMLSGSPCDYQVTDEVLDAVKEGEDFFAALVCGELLVSGTATTEQDLDLIAGGALIWDSCGDDTAGAFVGESLGPGQYTIAVESGSGVMADIPVEFEPEGVDFADSILVAAGGNCADENKTPTPGTELGYAGWIYCAPRPEPPTGSLVVDAAGFCSVNGDSNGAGATEGSGL